MTKPIFFAVFGAWDITRYSRISCWDTAVYDPQRSGPSPSPALPARSITRRTSRGPTWTRLSTIMPGPGTKYQRERPTWTETRGWLQQLSVHPLSKKRKRLSVQPAKASLPQSPDTPTAAAVAGRGHSLGSRPYVPITFSGGCCCCGHGCCCHHAFAFRGHGTAVGWDSSAVNEKKI